MERGRLVCPLSDRLPSFKGYTCRTKPWFTQSLKRLLCPYKRDRDSRSLVMRFAFFSTLSEVWDIGNHPMELLTSLQTSISLFGLKPFFTTLMIWVIKVVKKGSNTFRFLCPTILSTVSVIHQNLISVTGSGPCKEFATGCLRT